ncbi:hypothetical protein K474DRAFT_1708739 [Panus rudis PR-1116 ss-1]|nr:hypothetical protein K474DRAFT_1708739 [Panus rudis PR-1116 ss-1]
MTIEGQQPFNVDSSILHAVEDDSHNLGAHVPSQEGPEEQLEDAPPYEAFEDFPGNLGAVQGIVETIEYRQDKMYREVKTAVDFAAMAMTQCVELTTFVSELVVGVGEEVQALRREVGEILAARENDKNAIHTFSNAGVWLWAGFRDSAGAVRGYLLKVHTISRTWKAIVTLGLVLFLVALALYLRFVWSRE